MVKVESSVVINRPVEEVFAVVSDLEKNPKWAPGFLEVKKTSQGPIGVGTTWRAVREGFGQRMESDVEVTEYEPNRKCTHKGNSPFPGELQMTFERVAEGTRVHLRLEAESGGFFKVAEPVLARMAKRNIKGNLANLKDLMEAGAL